MGWLASLAGASLAACAALLAPSRADAFSSFAPDVTAQPGATVSVFVQFTGDGSTWENLDYLAYDNARFVPVQLRPSGGLQCSVVQTGRGNVVRMFTSTGSASVPLVSESCLVDFRVATTTAPGRYALEFVIDSSIQPQSYCEPNGANCAVRDGSITVTAGAPPARPTLAFSATPRFAPAGSAVTLAWSTTNATGCTPGGGAGTSWPQAGQLPTSFTGNLQLPTTATGTIVFVLSCQGAGGTVSQEASVTIGAPPAPPALRPVARVNPTVDGQRPSGPSTRPALAANGRAVVFESAAANLVPGDTNGRQDVFLRDLATNQTLRVTVGASGQQTALVGGEPSVDRNGERVVMTMGSGLAPSGSGAKSVTGGQISLYNKSQQRTMQVSTNAAGTAPGNGESGDPQISEDGTRIVFRSEATDLTPEPDTNGVADVFLFEVATGAKSRLSDAAAPRPAGDSAKGGGAGVRKCSRPAGNRVVCEVLRGARIDLVAYALGAKAAAGTTVSVGAGAAANGDSNHPVLSSDGRFVFFDSAASNLVPGDTNARRDVFRVELDASGTPIGVQRASVSTLGAQGNGDSERPGTCGDGRYVTFESIATNLVAGDDGQRDVFARDLASGVVVKLSQPGGGAGAANGASSAVAFSPDCSAIAYATSAENLAAGGASGQDDVVAGASPFQSVNVTGGWFDLAQLGHGLFVEHLDDERVVASWYTFSPDARQAWLIGVGTLMGNTVTMPMLMPQGGRFPPSFAPATNTPFGTMTLRFDDCDDGLLTFAFPAPYGNGTMPLKRPELAAGVSCSGIAPLAAAAAGAPKRDALPTDAISAPRVKATGPVAALTGSWANPAQLGHGLQMEVLTGDRLVVAWYVFTPTGEQMWLIGAGPISGQSATVAIVRPTGGRFIPNFVPAQVTTPSLGTLTVTALTCNTARVNYAFPAPFGTGTFPISRVTAARGAACTP